MSGEILRKVDEERWVLERSQKVVQSRQCFKTFFTDLISDVIQYQLLTRISALVYCIPFAYIWSRAFVCYIFA